MEILLGDMDMESAQEALDAIDRLVDKCIEDRIYSFHLKQGVVGTFFPKEMLAEQLGAEFIANIEDEFRSIYGAPARLSGVTTIDRNAFQLCANIVSFDILRRQVHARLQQRLVDFASDLYAAIRARWETRLACPHCPHAPAQRPDSELRLWLW